MNSKVFDVDATMERVDNDRELLCELVEICLSEKITRLAAIEASIASGDAKKLDSESHAIKSALGNIGAMRSHAISSALEQCGKQNQLSEAPDLFEKFKIELNLFEEAFNEFKKS